MEFINEDITNITFGFVCHQVNCQGVMGAGVALAIRKKWPVAYAEYKQAYTNGALILGNIIFAKIQADLYVVHICGQDRYGRIGIYTNYEALHKAIHSLSEMRRKVSKDIGVVFPVYFPNGMGCRLAGGDWNVVIKIIEKYIPDAKIVNYTH